jgi:hypothetical protein
MISDHSREIAEVQALVASWDHERADDWPVNRAIIDALLALVPRLRAEDCDYTFSHTRETCGNPRCREY